MAKKEQKTDEINQENILTKIIAFRVTKNTYEKFKKILAKSEIEKSEILRNILIEYILNNK
jgi:VIT1/CCC1 family predicted Fe2+/Mn2+ transporter